MIRENVSLANLNTLGLPASARYFTEVSSIQEIRDALAFARDLDCAPLILGGGSNLVLVDDFPGLVLSVRVMGKEVVTESPEEVILNVGAGENWHGLVDYSLERGWYGLENLALIPGCVGAAPIQNIGAYGVELCEVFDELQAIEIASGKIRVFSREDCQFGYRDSIFKRESADRFLISSVTLVLNKTGQPNLGYAALQQALVGEKPSDITPQRVRDTVCAIRSAKLPDPNRIGNVGSFFKNPVVSAGRFEALKNEFENIVGFPEGEERVKLAAGWLIEQCGWKGHREGAVGVHPAQALVLVNYESRNPDRSGRAGEQLLALAARIQESVQEKFGVLLEPEPRIYPESLK